MLFDIFISNIKNIPRGNNKISSLNVIVEISHKNRYSEGKFTLFFLSYNCKYILKSLSTLIG